MLSSTSTQNQNFDSKPFTFRIYADCNYQGSKSILHFLAFFGHLNFLELTQESEVRKNAIPPRDAHAVARHVGGKVGGADAVVDECARSGMGKQHLTDTAHIYFYI